MNSTWDESALTIDSAVAPAWSLLSDSLPPIEAAAISDWSAANGADEEASVGQWLANIGSGAATGAASGAVAGPWGALVGGLIGGGLGAAQTAMAPAQPPTPLLSPAAPPPRSPAPRPAPTRRTTPSPRPPASRQLAHRPPAPPAPTSPAADPRGTQLIDQLATLLPVIAALAAQVSLQAQAAGPAPAGVESLEGAADWGTAPGAGQAASAPGWDVYGEDTPDLESWPESMHEQVDDAGCTCTDHGCQVA